MSCSSCGRPVPPVDVARDVLDLTANVLAAGPHEEYRRAVDQLLRTPETSLRALATVLLSVSCRV